MINSISKENIQINLNDIGCTNEQIEAFMNEYNQKHFQELLKFLKIHRGCLLDQVHKEQKQIDN